MKLSPSKKSERQKNLLLGITEIVFEGLRAMFSLNLSFEEDTKTFAGEMVDTAGRGRGHIIFGIGRQE